MSDVDDTAISSRPDDTRALIRMHTRFVLAFQYLNSNWTTIKWPSPWTAAAVSYRTSGRTCRRAPPGAWGTWTRPGRSRCSWATGRAHRPSTCPPTSWTRTGGTSWRSRSKERRTGRGTSTRDRRSGTANAARTTAVHRWPTPTLKAFDRVAVLLVVGYTVDVPYHTIIVIIVSLCNYIILCKRCFSRSL